MLVDSSLDRIVVPVIAVYKVTSVVAAGHRSTPYRHGLLNHTWHFIFSDDASHPPARIISWRMPSRQSDRHFCFLIAPISLMFLDIAQFHRPL